MANIKLGGTTALSESGGTVVLDSAVTGIPAAGVTGTLPNTVQDNITRLGTVTSGSTGGLRSQQVFTSSGTWTKPTGISTIKVYVTGGGGGGGGGNASWNHGAGGCAGGTSIKIIDVSSITSETVTIGPAGNGGAHNTNAGGGSTSSFGSHCSALGGKGGAAASQYTGVNTGVGLGGDINIYGGNGTSAGGGAGGADETGGFVGGSSFWGGGMEGASSNSGNPHTAPGDALCYGSGGGPGDDVSGSGVGKAGAAGVCVIEEYS